MEEKKLHYKMYKDGKKFVFAAIASMSFFVFGGVSTVEVHADTTSGNLTATTVNSTSDMTSAVSSAATVASSASDTKSAAQSAATVASSDSDTKSVAQSAATVASSDSDTKSVVQSAATVASSDSDTKSVVQSAATSTSSSAVRSETTSASELSTQKDDVNSNTQQNMAIKTLSNLTDTDKNGIQTNWSRDKSVDTGNSDSNSVSKEAGEYWPNTQGDSLKDYSKTAITDFTKDQTFNLRYNPTPVLHNSSDLSLYISGKRVDLSNLVDDDSLNGSAQYTGHNSKGHSRLISTSELGENTYFWAKNVFKIYNEITNKYDRYDLKWTLESVNYGDDNTQIALGIKGSQDGGGTQLLNIGSGWQLAHLGNFFNTHLQFFKEENESASNENPASAIANADVTATAVSIHMGFTDIDNNEAVQLTSDVINKVYVDNATQLAYQHRDGYLSVTRQYNDSSDVSGKNVSKATFLMELDVPVEGFDLSVATIGNQKDSSNNYIYGQGSKVAPALLSTMKYTEAANVTYIDDTTGKTLSAKDLTGDYGSTDPYRTGDTIADYEKQGYQLVSDNYPTHGVVYNQDGTVQSFEVHLTHGTTPVGPNNPQTPGEPINPDNPDGPKWPEGTDKSSVTQTVIRTVNYLDKQTGKVVAKQVTEQVTYNRTAIVDKVTGKIIGYSTTGGDTVDQTDGDKAWTAVDNKSDWDSVTSPDLSSKGYLAPDLAAVAQQTVTPGDKDVTVNVYYDHDVVPVNPTNPQTPGEPINPDNPDGPKWPEGTDKSSVTQTVIRTVNYLDKQTGKVVAKQVTEQVTYNRTAIVDKVTGKIIGYSTTGGDTVDQTDGDKAWTAVDNKSDWDSVTSPDLSSKGYLAPDLAAVAQQTVTPGDKDVTVNVYYDHDVVPVNPTNPQTPGTPINPDDPDSPKWPAGTDKNSLTTDVHQTIHYQYGDGSQAAPDKTDSTTFNHQVEIDKVTGEIVKDEGWTAENGKTSFDSKKSPVIPGYTASKPASDSVDGLTHDSKDDVQTIIYTANQEAANVTYIDDTTGKTLSTKDLTGDYGSTDPYRTGDTIADYEKQGYQLVSDNYPTHGVVYNQDGTVQKFEVHLTHGTTPVGPKNPQTPGEPINPDNPDGPKWPEGTDKSSVTQTVIRTVNYLDKQTGKVVAKQVTEQVTYNRTAIVDKVTGKIIGYSTTGGDTVDQTDGDKAWTAVDNKSDWDSVTSPDLSSKGYLAPDLAAVAQQTVTPGDKDVTVNVYYDHDVVPVNPTNPQTPGTPINPDDPDSPKWPAGTDKNSLTTDVHQTIHYQYGDGSQAAPDKTDSTTFNHQVEIDKVTGEIVKDEGWTAENGKTSFDSKKSPVIPGYTASKPASDSVDGLTHDSKDDVQTIIYTANQEAANVTYIDDTTGKTLSTKDLTGDYGSTDPYRTGDTIADYEKQGYQLVSDNYPTHGVVYNQDGTVQKFEVHLTHGTTPVGPKNPQTPGEPINPDNPDGPKWPEGTDKSSVTQTVIRTVNYLDKQTGKVVAKQVTEQVTYNRTAIVDKVTGKIIGYSTTGGDTVDQTDGDKAWTAVDNKSDWDSVTSPDLSSKGYLAPDLAAVAQQTVTPGDKDVTVNVYYDHDVVPVNPTNPQTPGTPINPDDPDSPKWPAGTDKNSLTTDVHQTIHYQYGDGSQAAPDKTDSTTFNHQVEIDKVTGEIVKDEGWTAENGKTSFDSKKSPVIPGYTASKPASDSVDGLTHDSKDDVQTIIYTANQEAANVTYIDDTTGKTLSTKDLTGDYGSTDPYRTGDTIADYEKQGYQLVSDNYPTHGVVYNQDGTVQKFEVHLTHGTTPVGPKNPQTPGEPINPDNPDGPKWPEGTDKSSVTQTVIRTVNYLDKQTGKVVAKQVTEQVTYNRTAIVDKVTGKIIGYSTTGGDTVDQTDGDKAWTAVDNKSDWDSVTSPDLSSKGYLAPDLAAVAQQTVTPGDKDVTVNVYYDHDVVPVNPTNPQTPGEPINPDNPDGPKWPEGTDKSSVTQTVIRTVNYLDKQTGKVVAKQVTEQVTYNRTAIVDKVTGKIIGYSTTGGDTVDQTDGDKAWTAVDNKSDWDSVTSPDLSSKGYLAPDLAAVAQQTVTPGDKDVTVNVYYDHDVVPVNPTNPQTPGTPINPDDPDSPKWPAGTDKNSLTTDVHQTIHYQYGDGSQAAPDKTDSTTFNHQVEIDKVTGEIVKDEGWTAENGKTSFDSKKSPVIPGYTASKPASDSVDGLTHDSKDDVQTIIYTANQEAANVTYIDDTTGKTLSTKDLTGDYGSTDPYRTGDTIADYEKQGYQLVSDNYPTHGVVYNQDGTVQKFEVHLTHGTTPVGPKNPQTPGEPINPDNPDGPKWPEGTDKSSVTQTVIRTVNYLDKQTGKVVAKQVTEQVTYNRTAIVDKVTGKIIGYSTTGGDTVDQTDGDKAWTAVDNKSDWDSVTSPDLSSKGYLAPDLAAVAQQTVTPGDKDVTVNVYYDHDVVPVNPTNPQTPGTPINPDDPDSPKWPAGTDKNSLTTDVHQTIHYQYGDGSQAAPDKTDSTTFNHQVEIDKVTGEIVKDEGWTAENGKTSFDSKKSPVIPGYTASKPASDSVDGLTHDSKDDVQTIIYTANQEAANVTYIDDTTGKTLSTKDLTGDYGSTDPYRTGDTIADYEKQGYQLVSDNYPTHGVVYNQDGTVQKFEVHLTHGTTPVGPKNPQTPGEPINPDNPDGPKWPEGTDKSSVTQTVIRTVNYLDKQTGKVVAKQVTEQVTYNRTAIVDKVTGKIIGYSTTGGDTVDQTDGDKAWTAVDNKSDWDSVTSPDLSSKGYLAPDLAAVAQQTVTPGDKDVTVNVYYDHDVVPVNPTNPQTPGTPINPDDPDSPKWPAGTDKNSLTTDVHQTIHYQYGDGSQAAPDKTDSTTFNHQVEIDKVTGEIVKDEGWTAENGKTSFDSKKSPVIPGYTASKPASDSVDGLTHDSKDDVQTIVYAKTPVAGGNVTAKYVDENGNPIADDVIASGNVGDPYSTTQKDVPGYTFKEVQGNPTGSFTDQDQTVTYVYTKNPSTDNNGGTGPNQPEKPGNGTDTGNPSSNQPGNPSQPSNATNNGVINTSTNTGSKVNNGAVNSPELPQTGENNRQSQTMSFIGVSLAMFGSLLGFLGIKKRRND